MRLSSLGLGEVEPEFGCAQAHRLGPFVSLQRSESRGLGSAIATRTHLTIPLVLPLLALLPPFCGLWTPVSEYPQAHGCLGPAGDGGLSFGDHASGCARSKWDRGGCE